MVGLSLGAVEVNPLFASINLGWAILLKLGIAFFVATVMQMKNLGKLVVIVPIISVIPVINNISVILG
jgi:hypothetical protein